MRTAAIQARNRVDQDIDSFDRELAQEFEIGRIGRERDRREFSRGDAVMNDAYQTAGPANLVVKDPGAIGALEQIEVAARHQHTLEREVGLARPAGVIEQKTSAIRRIGAQKRRPWRGGRE